MAWIICGHLFFYAPNALENLHMIFTYAESWYLQPLFAVAMAVDTYFVIRYLIKNNKIKSNSEFPLEFLLSFLNHSHLPIQAVWY